MPVSASAPGKLVLLGEYAVLENAPALVMAVNRRARVMLTETRNDRIVVRAPALGITAECHWHDNGWVEWLNDARAANQLHLVTAILESSTVKGSLPAFRAELDTNGFFLHVQGARSKLGLGSSAALTVALAGALCVMQGRPAPALDALIALHRRIQGGRGSGLDIAAAQQGGVTIYRLNDGAPATTQVALPSGLVWCCVWTGKPASTGDFLRHIAAWSTHEPRQYNEAMARLKTVAFAGAEAAHCGKTDALMRAVKNYAAALAEFGAASGLDIVSREHREIAALAAASGVVYKSCGAGGGDVGIAMSMDYAGLAGFRERIARAGFRTLDLAVDPQGLEARTINEHQ